MQLNLTGTIPSVNLPPLAITDVHVVASEAAQLALTAEEGDVAIRSDESKTYIHNGGTAATMADWSEISASAGVLSVNGYTGTVVLDAEDVGAAMQTPTQDAAPSSPVDGDLWWDSINGKLKIYYHDGDSGQWVDASPASAGVSELNGLTDVDLTTTAPSDGDVLVYNSTTGKWEPIAPSGGNITYVEATKFTQKLQ